MSLVNRFACELLNPLAATEVALNPKREISATELLIMSRISWDWLVLLLDKNIASLRRLGRRSAIKRSST